MPLFNLKKNELVKARQDLTEVKRHLEKCLKLQNEQLVRELQDVPFDKMLQYDKRMAVHLKNMYKDVYEGPGNGIDCYILIEMKDAIDKIDRKLEYVSEHLEK